jgi:lipopolysaccharide/colanic/teichoic acid biosynthesis glycosyltransferase
MLKRMLDLTVAPLLLLLTSPIWLVAVIWIRLDSPGPILFSQERVGLGGRPFKMLKFRSMWQTAPKYAPSPNGNVDPRITRVGRLLRRTGFDELPQLLNVIAGTMSLVGPRPEMPFLVAGYTPLQLQRLQVKPGITGLWQISVDRHAEIHENIEYDLYYVSHQSVLLDVLILLETLFFTAGLLLRPTWRREQNDRTVALPTSTADTDAPAVVLALDQRRSAEAVAEWRQWVPLITERFASYPVHVLVAAQNVSTFDELTTGRTRAADAPNGSVRYVSCESQHDLRMRVERARLVISNLPNVGLWAANAGVTHVSLEQLLHGQVDLAHADDLLGVAPVRVPRQTPWSPVVSPTAEIDSRLQPG